MKTRQRSTSRRRALAGRRPRVVPVPLTAAPRIATHSARHARPVLIATDGSAAAEHALKIARAMADRGMWAPEVITVCEPLPVAVGPVALPEVAGDQQLAITNSLLQQIRRTLRRIGGAEWKLSVEYGRAAPHIVRAARDAKAGLIVMGLGHHSTVARLFGAETAARVVRHSDIPVIAVHKSARHLPRMAVVAIDFGDSSIRAAHEALALLEPPARLHLVHVKWGYNTSSLRDSEWDRAYSLGVERGFERLKEELRLPAGVDLTTETVHGAVIKSLLDIAKLEGADLIALGSHSQTIVDRLVIGSTPAEVLRESPCSVLIAPPADAHT